MAAERRFAALAQIKRRTEGEGDTEDVPALEAEVNPSPAPAHAPHPANVTLRPQGRPPGKRSDPEWRPRTILMKTKTHRRVSAILLERDEGPDLSELVDQLLMEWIAKQ